MRFDILQNAVAKFDDDEKWRTKKQRPNEMCAVKIVESNENSSSHKHRAICNDWVDQF